MKTHDYEFTTEILGKKIKLPEYSLYSEGIQNKQVPHGLRKCTFLHRSLHPKPMSLESRKS
ncbi:hypothetical protein HanIR_Chr16g0789651 [Helianthus annuus]|nr:hypothetical protein HanIR_Chr16g0789651 [Helianthus annuus]